LHAGNSWEIQLELQIGGAEPTDRHTPFAQDRSGDDACSKARLKENYHGW